MDASPDAAPSASTAALLAQGTYSLTGVLPNGLLLVVDGSSVLYTLDPKTTTKTQIAAKADGGATVQGEVVFVSHDVDSSGASGLGVWTQATGYHDFGVTKSSLFAGYTDGTNVAYFSNIDSTTFAGDLTIDTLTHSAPKTAFTGQAYSQFPIIANGKLLVVHASATATPQTGPLTAYDLATGTGTDLLASALTFYTSNTQSTAIVVSGTPNTLIDLTTGNQISLGAEVLSTTFSPDGKSIYANTTTNGFEVITWSGTKATTGTPLLTTGVGLIYSGSADNQHALYGAMFDDTTFTSDLSLLDLATPTSHPSIAASGVTFAQFSPDSAYVVYSTGVDQTTFVGTLNVAPVSAPTAQVVSTSASSQSSFVGNGQMLVLDNASSSNADLELVTLATPTAPSKLATAIAPYFLLSSDNKTIYYVRSTAMGTSAAGVYALTLP